MNKNHLHIIVAAVLAFFLLALADLIPFWMPMMGQTSLVTIDQAAHLSIIEKPAEFDNALRGFLDSVA